MFYFLGNEVDIEKDEKFNIGDILFGREHVVLFISNRGWLFVEKNNKITIVHEGHDSTFYTKKWK